MNNQSHTSKQSISCTVCQESLADYVRSELNGDNVSITLPLIAHHVETCDACTSLYFGEFRQQGRQRSLTELQALGERHRTATVLDQILAQAATGHVLSQDTGTAVQALTVEPTWRELLIQQGRLWLDQSSEQVRQLSVALGEVLTPIQPNAATAGLMSGTAASTGPAGDGTLSGVIDLPARSGLEVKVIAEPILSEAGSGTEAGSGEDANMEPQYEVQVAVTLTEHLGDYSGVGVTMRWNQSVLSAETDAMGIARFGELDASSLPLMSLTITV